MIDPSSSRCWCEIAASFGWTYGAASFAQCWQGIHIGLTSVNAQGGFAYVKLAREADGKDWAGTPACISVNGAQPAACGSLLMDTGVTTMYLTVPENQAEAK
jgi:hypothetical protein